MTLAIIASLSVEEGQLSWPTAAVAARVKRNVMQAFCPQRPVVWSAPWGTNLRTLWPERLHHVQLYIHVLSSCRAEWLLCCRNAISGR